MGIFLILLFGFDFARFDNQGIGYQFPEVLHLHVEEAVFLSKAFHDLIAAVMAWGDKELRAGFLNLLCFNATVEDSFLHVRGRPCAAAGAAAEVVGAVGIHFHEIFTALLQNPPGLIVVSVPERPLALAAVVAGIVVGGQMAVDRLIELDSPLFYILLEQIENAEKLDAFIRIPFLQTKPGRIVGVPSLGQDEVFALQFLVILHNPPDDFFH